MNKKKHGTKPSYGKERRRDREKKESQVVHCGEQNVKKKQTTTKQPSISQEHIQQNNSEKQVIRLHKNHHTID